MTDRNDTIAAIATGLTPSGIGIIRMSGPESYAVIGRIFTNKYGNRVDFEKHGRIHYGFINVSRETLDEVLVMNMKAPNSYTGEDTIEIDCHGGPLMMRRILEAVTENGARLAEPGEFTKRAFLNGRIDLAQAEAVIDIIRARNDSSMKASVAQLKGSVSAAVKELRDVIISRTAYIEAALDDPEHYALDDFGKELLPVLEKLIKRTDGLIESYGRGRLMKEGVNICILGRPNAGKSSLLNALLREDRAIVTEIPGTTRDVITESIEFSGLTLNITDTAGIRHARDAVEKIGVKRAYEAADEADLVLYVVDSSKGLDESDTQIISFLESGKKKAVCLLNKSDLPEAADIKKPPASFKTLRISAVNGEGVGELLEEIADMFCGGELTYNDELVITSARHTEALKSAGKALMNVVSSIEAGLPEDFYTIDMMDAYRYLGLIIGETTEDDLADRIFSEFCMGK